MIEVRKPKFEFDKHARSYWYADNKFATSLFSALSVTFPAGEKFFITSVRDNMDVVDDPNLIADVKSFSQQEGQHSQRHVEFNNWLAYKGFKPNEFEVVVRIALSMASKLPKKYRLAATCALEHITSILAERLIDEANTYDRYVDGEFRDFWKWHAQEEAEHKAVAYDVYVANEYDEGTRIAVMILASAALVVATLGGQAWMYWTKTGKRGLGDFVRGMALLYGPKGFISRSIPAYLTYYRPFFHPNDRD